MMGNTYFQPTCHVPMVIDILHTTDVIKFVQLVAWTYSDVGIVLRE